MGDCVKLAFFTDIHANREAFDMCLAEAEARGASRIVILGDIVGYGADPNYVVTRVRELVARGAMAVKGNHDDYAIRPQSGMVEHARRAIEWTRDRLEPEARDFLAGLPMSVREDDRLYVHASAHQPETWPYIDACEAADRCLQADGARLIFCGHTHLPAAFHALPGRRAAHFRPQPNHPLPVSAHRRYVMVVGSVGQPRDRNPHACWGLLDLEARTFAQMRVPYDIETTRQKILDAGLPDWLGRRLAEGR